jgi:type IV pilus assembly protein PilK
MSNNAPDTASPAARGDSDAVAPQAWCDLILRRSGLAFRSTRVPDVLAVVRERMRACGVATERAFYQHLSAGASTADWDALVDRLTNNETSFFRHPASFDALRRQILPELRDARPRGGRLNLWSAGCSTGQEAYSLAMVAMADPALNGEVTVWGGDISQTAIEVARRGRYNHRAVATVPDGFRARFLRPAGPEPASEFDVAEELRQRVRFIAMNLAEAGAFRLNYDVIFCHNVLIYFAPAVVTSVVAFLASCLKQGGYLLLGPGEAPNERPAGLEPVTVHGVRAFHRRAARPIEVRE